MGVVAMLGVLCLSMSSAVQYAIVAMFTVAAVLVIGVAWPVVASRAVTARVVCAQHRVTRGEGVVLHLWTLNRLPVPLPQFRLEGHGIALIPPGESTRQLTVPADRRGEMRLSDWTLSTAFPFGLTHQPVSMVASDTVIVWPRPAIVDSEALHALTRSTTAQRSTASSGSEGDYAGVRPYRRGDSARHVHWQQTARLDRLMVRERTSVDARQCEITLDTRAGSYTGLAHFDAAVEMLAGLLKAALVEQAVARVQINESVLTVADETSLAGAMDALAVVGCFESDEDDLMRHTPNLSGLYVTSPAGALALPSGSMVPILVEAKPEAL